MDENNFIKLLQHRRHDILNEFQVIQGYLSMEKTNKVHDKIDDVVASFQEERLLFQTNAPKFIMFIQQMKHVQNSFLFSYQIKTGENDLSPIDEELHKKSEQFLNWFHEVKEKNELYHIKCKLNQTESNKIEWKAHIEPPVHTPLIFEQSEADKYCLQSGHIESNEIEMICTFEINLKKVR